MKPERPDPDPQRAGSAASRLAAAAAGAGADDVPSPCVSICEMSLDTGLCKGCFRTLDEIAAWSVLDAATRRAIVDALPARRATVERSC